MGEPAGDDRPAGWFLYPNNLLQTVADGREDARVIRAECTRSRRPWKDSKFGDVSDWSATLSLDSCFDSGAIPTVSYRISQQYGDAQPVPLPSSADAAPPLLGRVFQGALSNGYLIEALQAVSLRPRLVRDLFVDYDMSMGFAVVRIYINGFWFHTNIDDRLPCDDELQPLCCCTDQHPYIVWAPLLEKAMAKLYGSWEALGNGGDTVAAMVALTGGVGGVWYVRDVSPDRVFVYMHALQSECLWSCRPNADTCTQRGVKLPAVWPYSVSRVLAFEGRCFIQIKCSGRFGGPFDDTLPHALVGDVEYNRNSVTEGLFWLSIEDFCQYFEVVHEVRLVQQGPDELARIGLPPPRMQALLHEYSFATENTFGPCSCPEFTVSVSRANLPCEVLCQVTQGDLRLTKHDNREYPPLLLRVFRRADSRSATGSDAYTFVCKSFWCSQQHTFVAWKTQEGGDFLVLASMPTHLPTDAVGKLVFRCYSSAKLNHNPNAALVQTAHDWVPTRGPALSDKFTLVGAQLAIEPLSFDVEDGEGAMFGKKMFTQIGSLHLDPNDFVMTDAQRHNAIKLAQKRQDQQAQSDHSRPQV